MKKQIVFIVSLLFILCIYSSQTINKSSAHTQEKTSIPDSQQQNQPREIPEDIAYEQFFRIINSFEKEAQKQESQGFLSRAETLRKTFQEILQLDSGQFGKIKEASSNFLDNAARLKLKAKKLNASKSPKSKKIGEMKKIEERFNQLPLIYRDNLRKVFGEEDFERFAKSFREKIAAKMSYRLNTESKALFIGFSEVSYDSASGEIIGYSWTPNDGTDCDLEEGHHCVGTEVYAVLSGDNEGAINSDSSQDCNMNSEVFLYSPGSFPGTNYCVDGSHTYDDYTRCGFQGGGIYSSSSDCLTTPPTPNVTSISFQPIASNNLPIDTNQNIGGGLRIFPDDNAPMENANRQTIQVIAGISEPVAGRTVYFRNFDVDDPSTDTTIDPNGNMGDDNNGRVNNLREGQLSAISAMTNSNGIAMVNFTVTMQPGDNFAIAASTDPNQVSAGAITVNGADLLNGQGQVISTSCDYSHRACRSEMLTVWRRLHIEVDSMGAAQGNFVPGSFAESRRVGGIETIVQVNTSPALEPNRFEDGRLVSGLKSFHVVRNTTDTVTLVSSDKSGVAQGELFQLFDDDDFNDDDAGALNGDTGDEIPRPDTTLLSISDDESLNVFAPAYIRPAQRPTGGENEDVPFAANTGETEITNLFNTYFDNQATEADPEFWTVYLLGGYQFRTNRDGDPYTLVNGFLNTVWGASDTGNRQTVGRGSILFTEEGRAGEYPADWANRPVSRAHTVAHEVGHLFGCIHDDGGLMDDTTRRTSGTLTPPCLNQIRRNATHP